MADWLESATRMEKNILSESYRLFKEDIVSTGINHIFYFPYSNEKWNQSVDTLTLNFEKEIAEKIQAEYNIKYIICAE